MVISWVRSTIVRFALIGLVCVGVIGGIATSPPTASAMPMSCNQVLAAGDDAANSAWYFWGVGNYQMAQIYFNRADRYYSYYDARC